MRLLQFLQKDKTRGAVPRVMQQEKGQLQGGLRYLGQLFKQLQVIALLIVEYKQPVTLSDKLARAVSSDLLASWCTIKTAETSEHAGSDRRICFPGSKHCLEVVLGMCRRCGTPLQRS